MSHALEQRVKDQLEQYLTELQSWGERMNLVGSLERVDIEVHFEDSLAVVDQIPKGIRLADLGSGAGLPGIPIAIARPDLDLTLVEIREKRVHFLRHIVRTLGLDIRVERRRLEDPPPERFDIATMRAVASPDASQKLGVPWLCSDGELWIWTTKPAPAGATTIPLPRGHVIRIPS